MQFPTKRTTFSRHGGKLKPSPLQPVLPLLPEVLPTKDQDKAKFISFKLKSRAGQPADSTTYKKFVRVFEEGTPQQWIDLIQDVEEIWTQNTVNGPTDRTSTIRALLKGESLRLSTPRWRMFGLIPIPTYKPWSHSQWTTSGRQWTA
jgi:hypothetical protein